MHEYNQWYISNYYYYSTKMLQFGLISFFSLSATKRQKSDHSKQSSSMLMIPTTDMTNYVSAHSLRSSSQYVCKTRPVMQRNRCQLLHNILFLQDMSKNFYIHHYVQAFTNIHTYMYEYIIETLVQGEPELFPRDKAARAWR
jgi:hypothetical protein